MGQGRDEGTGQDISLRICPSCPVHAGRPVHYCQGYFLGLKFA